MAASWESRSEYFEEQFIGLSGLFRAEMNTRNEVDFRGLDVGDDDDEEELGVC